MSSNVVLSVAAILINVGIWTFYLLKWFNKKRSDEK